MTRPDATIPWKPPSLYWSPELWDLTNQFIDNGSISHYSEVLSDDELTETKTVIYTNAEVFGAHNKAMMVEFYDQNKEDFFRAQEAWFEQHGITRVITFTYS
jgi:hypothetical protein